LAMRPLRAGPWKRVSPLQPAIPETPSSEIPEQFFEISKETDLYFEYSTNEKVALEVGAGAAVSGLKTMVTMKHVGLNVAADPLMTLAYTGVKGGMVVINADDPSCSRARTSRTTGSMHVSRAWPCSSPPTLRR